jgi:hypothetical protein
MILRSRFPAFDTCPGVASWGGMSPDSKKDFFGGQAGPRMLIGAVAATVGRGRKETATSGRAYKRGSSRRAEKHGTEKEGALRSCLPAFLIHPLEICEICVICGCSSAYFSARPSENLPPRSCFPHSVSESRGVGNPAHNRAAALHRVGRLNIEYRTPNIEHRMTELWGACLRYSAVFRCSY